MEVYLLLSKLGANNLRAIVGIYSFLFGRSLKEKELCDLLDATWAKGMECMKQDLSAIVRNLTGNTWDSKEIVPRTIFGETLEIQDC